MIRIDVIWLARQPLDMRAGPDTALARVVATFGAAQPHTAYLFANKRANRLKVLVHDGLGLWLAARRLHEGSLTWTALREGDGVELNREQLHALVLGLPWQNVGESQAITVLSRSRLYTHKPWNRLPNSGTVRACIPRLISPT